MGCRSSPFWFCQCSEAVRWIVGEEAQHKDILVYIDDFWAASVSRDKCQNVINTMQHVAYKLGVPLAEDKTIGRVTCLTFLGIQIDTVRQTLSLPKDKANEIYDLVCQRTHKSKCNKQELQSLIGSLMFASTCVPASRLFIQRLLFLLRGKSEQHATLTLDREFHLDLQWWKEFLPKWNGTASFLDNDWTSSSVRYLYTDTSSSLGMGAFFQNSWFQSRWPPWVKNQKPCIEYLEMLPILYAILVWGHKFANKRILMHCDNLGAVYAWKKLGSRNHGVLSVMGRMVAAAAHHNMQIKLEHIPGVMNDVADAISISGFSFPSGSATCGSLTHPFPQHLVGTGSGTSAINSLDSVVRRLQYHHIAPSTRTAYETRVRRFQVFCTANNYPHLPAIDTTVERFVASIFIESVSLSSARVYLAAIANLHAELSLPNPTSSESIHRLLKGFKRIAGQKSDKRFPVDLEVMRHMKDKLASMNLHPHDRALYWLAFTIAFFGAFRISEYASPAAKSFDGDTLLLSDVAIKPEGLYIRLRQSKTDQFGHGYIVQLSATGRSVCPVRAATRYLHFRSPTSRLEDPFFILASVRYLTRPAFERTLQACLQGLPHPERYSSHSLRIGAATTAAQNGASAEAIQQIGRWKSSCFTSYVRAEVPTLGLQPYANHRSS